MLISGSERSSSLNVVPPLRRSISLAASGVICIRPRAPALEVRVAELRLGVDDGGDQRRVDVLFGGLLADDVLVAQRQGQLLDRLVELAAGRPCTADDEADRRRRPPTPGAAASAVRLIAAASRSARTAPARGPRPSRRWRPRARPARAFSSWASWRASRSSTRAWPRAAARSRRTSSGGDDRRRSCRRPPPSPTRTAAAPRSRRSRSRPAARPASRRSARRPAGGSAARARSAARGRRRRSRRSGCGRPAPSGATSGPQRSTRRPSSGSESSSSWTTASLESVAAPKPREGGQRLGLPGRDAAGEADRQRRHRPLLRVGSDSPRARTSRRRPRRRRRANRGGRRRFRPPGPRRRRPRSRSPRWSRSPRRPEPDRRSSAASSSAHSTGLLRRASSAAGSSAGLLVLRLLGSRRPRWPQTPHPRVASAGRLLARSLRGRGVRPPRQDPRLGVRTLGRDCASRPRASCSPRSPIGMFCPSTRLMLSDRRRRSSSISRIFTFRWCPARPLRRGSRRGGRQARRCGPGPRRRGGFRRRRRRRRPWSPRPRARRRGGGC